MKYRKKPVMIDAVQFTVNNRDEVIAFLGGEGNGHIVPLDSFPNAYATIRTLEGPLSAKRGDWIIKGVKGEFYPCKPEIFAATYEEAE